MKNFQKKPQQGNYIPEYQRLQRTPTQMPGGQNGQAKNKKIFNFRKDQVSNQIADLEEEEKNITKREYEEDEEYLQNLSKYKVDDYSYVVFFKGECVQIISSEEELLEYIDKAVFEGDEPANPQNFEIFRKIPLAFGVYLK